jgi:hypothetical protein
MAAFKRDVRRVRGDRALVALEGTPVREIMTGETAG